MNPQDWSTFFTTAAEAGTTLVGLIIVAISVNLQRILAYPHLPTRAGAGIGALMLTVIASIVALVPQPPKAFALEVLALALLGWLFQIRSMRRMLTEQAPRRPVQENALTMVASQLQSLPFLVGAVLLVLGRPVGLHWIAGGVVATFLFAVLNAWALLIEILR